MECVGPRRLKRSKQKSRDMAEMAEAVKVAVRVRPLLPKERSDASEECIVCYDSQGVLTIQKEANQERHALMTPAKQRKAATVAAQTGHDGELETLAFDHVWGASSTQVDVFEQVKPLVDGAFNGYNSTVFAYSVIRTLGLRKDAYYDGVS